MTIEVSCECSMTYRVPDRYAGKKWRCRECGETIQIPASKPARTKAAAGEGPDAAARPSRPTARPRDDRKSSDSLHQIEPLNLAEGRGDREISSRLRLVAKAAVAEEAPSRKKTKKGEEQGSSEDARPGKKARSGKDSGTGKTSARKKADSEKPTKKSKGTLPARGRDEDESPREKAARPDPAEQRKRQVRLLAGSLVAALACVVFLVVVVLRMNAAEEAQKKTIETVREKIALARAALEKEDWAEAKARSDEAVQCVNKGPAVEDGTFKDELSVFLAQKVWIDRIVESQTLLASDPDKAFAGFEEVARLNDDALRPAGVLGLERLAATGRAGIRSALAPFKDDANDRVRAAARLGLIETGSSEGDRYLGDALLPGAPAKLKQAAVKRALDIGQSAPPALIVQALESATDPASAIGALDALRRMGQNPGAVEAVEKRTKDPDEGVRKAAEETLPYVKGEKL